MNLKLLIPIFLSSFLILELHIQALSSFLYWKYWWFDNLIHLLGGFTIALIVLFYAERFSYLKLARQTKFLFFALVGALVASVFWEIFEFKAGIVFVASNYTLDTFLDISMGLTGALIGGVFAHKVRKLDDHAK